MFANTATATHFHANNNNNNTLTKETRKHKNTQQSNKLTQQHSVEQKQTLHIGRHKVPVKVTERYCVFNICMQQTIVFVSRMQMFVLQNT